MFLLRTFYRLKVKNQLKQQEQDVISVVLSLLINHFEYFLFLDVLRKLRIFLTMQTNNDLTPDASSSSRKFFKAFNEPKSSGEISPTSMNSKKNFLNLLIGGSTKNWKNGHRRLSDFCQINKPQIQVKKNYVMHYWGLFELL
ncbi:hypothetical protein BpHYR1_050802 [Brachionus plicatilis]|uniref:Uncharacterized protein n=1 Tax=Brachionus plicatilis TaxID=10195 RepID=A0A3M7T7P3_BRAPC|nr:hypothetical protein BpHYR1_050802 [Brachionus plicatilis]